MTPKMIYLARRNPATTHEEFLDNWKGHSALAGQYPHISRAFVEVAQARIIQDDSLLPEASRVYDGFNILSLTSLADALEVTDHPDARTTLYQDELRVFASGVRQFSVLACESVLINGPRRPVVIAHFVRRRPGLDNNAFVRQWSGQHARSLINCSVFRVNVRRFAHNYVMFSPPAGFEYDGVAEYWFDNEDSVRRCFSDSVVHRLIFDQAGNFCDLVNSVLVLGRINLARPAIES